MYILYYDYREGEEAQLQKIAQQEALLQHQQQQQQKQNLPAQQQLQHKPNFGLQISTTNPNQSYSLSPEQVSI